jgi:Spy/CpxP family protein refolding chaperone
MKKLAIILTTVLIGGGLLLSGGCRHGHYNKDSHIEFVIDYLDEVLDLDPTQQALLAEIKKELAAKHIALLDSREKMHPLIKQQLTADRIDTTVVKEAIGEHRRQLDQIIDLAVDRFAEFHASLTPEQRQKLIAKLEKMKKWHADQDAK